MGVKENPCHRLRSDSQDAQDTQDGQDSQELATSKLSHRKCRESLYKFIDPTFETYLKMLDGKLKLSIHNHQRMASLKVCNNSNGAACFWAPLKISQ